MPDPTNPHRTAEPDATRLLYRQQTVLLSAFAADDLEPSTAEDAGPSAALRNFLTRDCERVTTREGRRWRLTPQVRTETLEALPIPAGLQTAPRLTPHVEQDAARNWAERFLRREAPPLQVQGFDELYAALTVVGWFRDAPRARTALADHDLSLPSADEVQLHLRRARLLQPLEALANESFTGRDRELATLADYLASAREDFEGWTEAPPWLVVHGPGGVGKSTLLSRYLLSEARPGHPDRIHSPQVYLTFERPELAPERPLTLLAEAARQLALLVPHIRPKAEKLEAALRRAVAADLVVEREGHSQSGRRSSHNRDAQLLITRFADLLTSPGLEHARRPPLLVLDTFEQVQRRGPAAQHRVLALLEDLRRLCPRLRVVAASRAPIDDPRFLALPLEGFAPATARHFLRRQLEESTAQTHLAASSRPPTDAELDVVIGTVGRNPLNLKLAAALLHREAGSLRDPGLHKRLQAETVQGVLYRRILDHLDDPDLRRIASPGLIVRKVTPDVIRRVLALPCGLGHVDRRRAEELFRRFRAEVALVVEVPGQNAVVHRADVRAVMLPLLLRDHAEVVEQIHRQAVAYYETLEKLTEFRAEDRAEELYHRLALNQPTAVLDGRWTDDAGRLLELALDELPPGAQVYLTERLGNTAPPELRAEADDEIWRQQALRAATELFQDGRAEEALTVLLERPRRLIGDAALNSLLIKVMSALGRWDEGGSLSGRIALGTADGIVSPVLVELVLTRARAAEDHGDFALAHRLLTEAWHSVRGSDESERQSLLLALGTARLRLFRRGGALDTKDSGILRTELRDLVEAMGSRDFARHPALIREAAAELGDEVPKLVAYTAEQTGVDLSNGGAEALHVSLTSEDLRDFTQTTGVEDALLPPEESTTDVPPEDAITSVDLGLAVTGYLERDTSHHDAWHRALVANYQHEVDTSPFHDTPPTDRANTQDETGDAVVFLPGFLGSSLVDTETGRRIWGDLTPTTLLRQLLTRDIGPLRVTAAERAGESGRLRPDGLVRTPTWLPLLGAVEPYRKLLDMLHQTVPHKDAVLVFAYDWRLSATTSARLLAEAAHRHLAAWRASPHRRRPGHPTKGEPRLVFVAHSTGGLVARAALAADHQLASATRDLVTIATPYHGTPAVAELLTGRRRILSLGPNDFAAGFPGLYDLLPDFRCVETPTGISHLRASHVRQLGGDPELAEAAVAARVEQSQAAFLPRTRAVVGIGQLTTQGLRFDNNVLFPLVTAPRLHSDGRPQLNSAGDMVRWDRGGDGLVPRDAATASASNAALFVSGRHGTLPSDPQVLAFIRAVLTDQGPTATRPRPAPDALIRPGLGLSLPDVVAPGCPWAIMVHGASRARVTTCRITDESTGTLASSPRLLLSDNTLVAVVTLPRAGLYRVTVTSGPDQVSDLLLTAGPDGPA